MKIDESKLEIIEGLRRSEQVSMDELIGDVMCISKDSYDHDFIFGEYCTIQEYINCPPEDVFKYLSNIHSLSEWTYSTRNFVLAKEPDLYMGLDVLGGETKIYCKVVSNPGAMTVDYHCAWDQGDELWMIYLMRVIPAELVFKKPGSVVLWTNCHHPYYDNNPHPELVPNKDRPWVGVYWKLFYGGHWIEMTNLKKILEYRHKNNIPLGPYVSE